MAIEDLTLIQLKALAKMYNLHNTIKGYSTMKKEELITVLKKHITMHPDNIVLNKSSSFEYVVPEVKKKAVVKKQIHKVNTAGTTLKKGTVPFNPLFSNR